MTFPFYPKLGTGKNQPIFLTDPADTRSHNVTIVNLRLDRAFNLNARGRVTLMLGLYDPFNSDAGTHFRWTPKTTSASSRHSIRWR